MVLQSGLGLFDPFCLLAGGEWRVLSRGGGFGEAFLAKTLSTVKLAEGLDRRDSVLAPGMGGRARVVSWLIGGSRSRSLGDGVNALTTSLRPTG